MDKEKYEPRIVGIVTGMILSFIVIVMMCMCSSCTTTKVVTVEKVKKDTVLYHSTIRDSIYLHDSTFIKEKGDTVWIERWHTKWQNHLAHDTTYISKTDSVPVPYEVIKEVPAKLTWWQEMRIHIADILMTAFVLVLIGWYIKKKFLP